MSLWLGECANNSYLFDMKNIILFYTFKKRPKYLYKSKNLKKIFL